MELKPYQRRVLNDLDLYLQYVEEKGDYARAFEDFVNDRTIRSATDFDQVVKYKDSIPGVPHVCLKVPTAGGKTFIAANAIDVIYRHFPDNSAKMIVWLVPSRTILDQTLSYLRNPAHPYRRKINQQFRNRVEIFDKEALSEGTGFNATTVTEQLNIAVLTFDALRTRLKDNRKIYEENSQMASFAPAIREEQEDEKLSLLNALRTLRPVVIVDEAHGATGDLSIEMLTDLNPSFVLDITATPKKRGNNILTQVHAIELKKENMVKLPVLVYNLADITGVIESAIHLQEKLERDAIQEHKAGGEYIRPIVLFQAQPRNASDTGTYAKIKKLLIDIGIPEEQVKIKTADINEIRNVDLFAPDCPVRFIITINALKEGWDCSFAYILASLADRSSQTDVQQIVGRILRQPYAKMHRQEMLNYSYVLTSSTKFIDTVKSIVEGLNMSGFGEHDYVVAEDRVPVAPKAEKQAELTYSENGTADIDRVETSAINLSQRENSRDVIDTFQRQASEANKELQKNIEALPGEEGLFYNMSEGTGINTYRMRDAYREQGKAIRLPMFFIRIPSGGYLFDGHEEAPLTRETLLEDFRLRHADSNISFELQEANLYQIDLENTVGKESLFKFKHLPSEKEKNLIDYILNQPREAQIKQLTGKFAKKIMSSMPNLLQSDVTEYISRIVSGFNADDMERAVQREPEYCAAIRRKIEKLADEHAEKSFEQKLRAQQIFAKETFSLISAIEPGRTSAPITKSLYEQEAAMNSFEERMINVVANLPNVVFWHRIMDRRGFRIRGFITHYPDFLIQLESGRIILLETKGDHLDGENTKAKIRLGNAWAHEAGHKYKYFMLFEHKQVDGAVTLDEAVATIKQL